jgi:hypothetical protein
VTFGALPDDVLLEIFEFYLALVKDWLGLIPEDAWHTLVHVCKRWRSIVFASPHRLELQLFCTNNRPVHNMARIAYRYTQPSRNVKPAGWEQAAQPRAQNRLGRYPKSEDGESILRVDISTASLDADRCACPSRFVLGWICPSTANTVPRRHSISISSMTFLGFTFGEFLFPDIFHGHEARQTCPWIDFEKTDLFLASRELSSPLSPPLSSKAIPSTWRISWPKSIHLYSLGST